jgi:hypothetical protein
MSIELFFIGTLRAIVEVALLSLLGQVLVGFLAGASRQSNPAYRIFSVITKPPLRLARFLAPQLIIDKHIPFLAFFALFLIWIALAYIKRLFY